MGFLDQLLPGFVARKGEVEKENLRQSDLSQQRENHIYEALLSAKDPTVAAMALSGLLESAQPRSKAKGFKGWLGEREASPTFQRMRDLINTPVTETTMTPGARAPELPLTSESLPGQVSGPIGTPQATVTTPPPTSASAAMPTTSSITGGPPPTPTGYRQPPTTPPGIEGPPQITTTTHPRQIFDTPEEAVRKKYTAEALGKQEGDRAAWINAGGTDAEWRQKELRAQRGGAVAPQHVAVELPGGEQRLAVFANGQYVDPDTGQPFRGAMPLQRTGSTNLGAERESIAVELGYGPAASIKDPGRMAHVNALLMQRKGALTPKDAMASARAMLPNGTVDQVLTLSEGLMTGTAAPLTTPTATSAGTAPAAAPSSPTATPTPPTGTPGPPPTPTAPAGAGGLKQRVLGATPTGTGEQSRETGKPLSPAIQAAVARTLSMNDNINKALTALEPHKQDTSLEGTMQLVGKYRAGTEVDPFALAAAQLPDLAGLQQAASATLGGASRSQRIYADKRQHTPRLPSGRQIMFAHRVPGLNADRVSDLSQVKMGDEGGFDSPATMYQKLVGLRDANLAFLRDIQQTAAGVAPASSHGAPPAPGSSSSAPPPSTSYQDASGAWHIQYAQ